MSAAIAALLFVNVGAPWIWEYRQGKREREKERERERERERCIRLYTCKQRKNIKNESKLRPTDIEKQLQAQPDGTMIDRVA